MCVPAGEVYVCVCVAPLKPCDAAESEGKADARGGGGGGVVDGACMWVYVQTPTRELDLPSAVR